MFLFAGPHNWFELRYFLMRLPARFGRSRNFFAVAFVGIFTLTVAYLAMPALYYANLWSGANWPDAIATWNTLLLLWLFGWKLPGPTAWTFLCVGALFAGVYNLFTCDWIAEKI